MGEGKLTPLTTTTPVNRQSRNIAHVITSTDHHISPAAFGQDRPRGYFSPYSQSYHSILFINVKNFHGSLTTVVRAQNDTTKTANITYTIFDRTLVPSYRGRKRKWNY